MSENKNVDKAPERGLSQVPDTNIAVSPGEVSSVAGSVKTTKTQPRVSSSSSERQIKFERAQKCLENAALVSKRIKEHRKATAELLGRPFEDDDGGDTASEMASTMSERTGYSAATDTSITLSVQDALNIPGISESLANTLKQKELLMERIKQYKEISKRPMKTSAISRKESMADSNVDIKKSKDTSDVAQLVNTIKEKENVLSVIQVKMKAMETTILDLQEKINEKDQIIEAKNKATTLMSDSLSKKDKDSLLLLEDTRQQMIKMQENFINMETEWKQEKERLIKQIEERDEKINNLEEANSILENSRFEISLAHSKLVEEVELKNKEILELQEKIEKLIPSDLQVLSQKEKEDDEEKGALEITNMVELTKKIELLEQLNCQIRQTNKELENKLATMNPEPKSPSSGSPTKKGSPLPTRKGGRNTASKMKSPWSHLSTESLNQDAEKKPNKNELSKLEMLVQSLNKDILDKEYLISQKDAVISELQSMNEQNEYTITELRSHVKRQSDKVDIGICTDTSEMSQLAHSRGMGIEHKGIEENLEYTEEDAKELGEKLIVAQDQIAALNDEIDSANRNMIKVKSTYKLKLKQMQKTIENFSKVSDTNAEIVRLNEEMHQLSQKVAELEEEKGNLQLHLVDYDSGRLTESDVYKKMVEMENLADARLKSISVLEAQKFDLVQELHELQQKNIEMEDKLADMSQLHSEQVTSEIKSVQLEEQIDQLSASKKELELVIENLKLDKEHLNGTIKALVEEKEELLYKLEQYIQENIELTDKLEKLSAEKVSSAESIEIVESLTTQEKMELEEYNKGMTENKIEAIHAELPVSQESISIEMLIEQRAELNKKIALFTQERQEVMEKMTKITNENESLHNRISEICNETSSLQNNIELLDKERSNLTALNEELNRQIEELKRERIDIMKDSVELIKPASVDEAIDVAMVEAHHDDKISGDKGNNRTKSVKQLYKEILKLKNTIKEREDEIGDCQMKILSLEEQQQKQNELVQSNSFYEMKVKSLMDEIHQLKEELENENKESKQQLIQFKQANEFLQQELQKLHQEYSTTINSRDARLHELENVLMEYEKQIFNYGNTLQQKDNEIAEYISQISKLNDVSQKLKSTIEVLEEEKAKDLNAELVKSLHKQISAYQKKLSENEEKLRILEEEKSQMLSLKVALENKNINLETEKKKMQETYNEKQNLIKELQAQQQKHSDEISDVMLQVKERDEEIHEIKLQLRKESIENEKLRTNLSDTENSTSKLTIEFEGTKEKVNTLSAENEQLHEQCTTIETKNKELMDKLKKFAATVKKKSSMYAEIECQLKETQKQLESKNEHLEQLIIQVETLPALQEKLKYAEEELSRLQSEKVTLEQHKSNDIFNLQAEVKNLEGKLTMSLEEVMKLNESYILLQNESHLAREENVNLKSQINTLNSQLAYQREEQQNNNDILTKISSLEADINQKQTYIVELLGKIENQEQQLNQLQFGHDAKIQEKDLYIESLEAEISKYKNRICRLEESISIMEGMRHTLERKADQLDSQLQEKQRAYAEFTTQEDHLVSRLAVLMDHDRVVEKQLYEIESENKEMQYKIQHVGEENQRLRKSLSDIQEYCNTLVEKASKTDIAELEAAKCQTQLHELETQLKQISHDHQTLLVQRKQDIDELEAEFNTQVENSIKEKKALSEKYEKVSEHVTQLEYKLKEYRNNAENLSLNLEELSRINLELTEKANKIQVQSPDYTEQYISEINKLNSIINSKNQEFLDFNNKIQLLQANNAGIVSSYESKISELSVQLEHSFTKIDQLVQESNTLKQHNEELQSILSERDRQIQELIAEKKVTFEMSIPKTEGMIISSTIESLNEGQKNIDLSVIESQIVSESPLPYVDNKHPGIKISESSQKQPIDADASPLEIVEDVIVSKKAYLCYKSDENDPEQPDDPFNSDEGWGLGECEEIGEVTPGLSHLNEKIHKLQKENETLKSDLETSNSKLVKVLKKLKELKANNDILSSELKISKQISQSSFLDSAIEDEMKINIQELEKKIEELTADLNKEKRDKDTLRKQNEIFHNANDRLTEMKEKLDNELELWKYKFKEANDKVSTLQWGGDSKDTPDHKVRSGVSNVNDTIIQEEMMKLEKENDELQSIIDQLTSQNKHLSSQQEQLKLEINNLNKQLKQSQSDSENYEILNNQLLDLQNQKTELLSNTEVLNKRLHDMEVRCNETTQQHVLLKAENEDIRKLVVAKTTELIENRQKLEEVIESSRQLETDCKNLMGELETAKSKLLWYEEQQSMHKVHGMDTLALIEKYSAIEDHCSQLKQSLVDANNKVLQLETENRELMQKTKAYDEHINELNAKLSHLNTENDQLLSTVAELRSSISSAVDQRGFEIAELWKQHLAQREADFQKTEQELRSQLNVSEAKYEQLLDNVQSSTQEETNKLVTMEQVTSLQNKLQDKEEHLRNLQDKYSEVINQLDMLRSEMEDEKTLFENKLLGQQEEYEKQIQDLSQKNLQHSEGYEQIYENLQIELAENKTNNEKLNQQVQELIFKIEESERIILDLTDQLRIKDSEIYQKTHDYEITLTQRNEEFENVRKQLLEYEKKIEDISYEKEAELAVLRLKMHEKGGHYDKVRGGLETEKASLTEALNTKIVECTNLNKQVSDLNKTLEEQSNYVNEMQTALESQEFEIVSLKDEISNLKDVLRSSSCKIEKHVTFASDTKPGTDGKQTENLLNKELLDAVPRAELDLALYMLHQRDVRCEELTMELTHLLEERDTLQLRLSDSLRSCEELKSTCKAAGLDLSISSSQETISELPSFTIEKEQQFVDVHRGQTSRSSSISDPDGDKPKLQAKLSELRSVRHSRDVLLRHDSEQRQLDLRLMHRDVAHLPPEAVDQLAQAHHTFSRDSQSTSTVLLNWLRGKSTPKAVHDM